MHLPVFDIPHHSSNLLDVSVWIDALILLLYLLYCNNCGVVLTFDALVVEREKISE